MTNIDLEKKIIGMTESEARSFLNKHNITLRIMEKDNQGCVGSCDYRPDRLNVSVLSGKIFKLLQFG